MKTKRIRHYILSCILIFVSCSLQKKSSETENKVEIDKVFNQYVTMNNTLNMQGIANCISDSEHFLWLEDGTIQYSNKSLFVVDLMAFFPNVKSMDLRITNRDINILNDEYATLFAEYLKDISLISGENYRFKGVMSVVMFKENEAWKFLLGHSSHKKTVEINQQLEQALQGELDSIVRINRLPGLTFSVLFDNGCQINLASGYSDKEKKMLMEPNSRMLAGSIGKMFVSALALKLVQDKKLKLEDKALNYLDDKPWFKSFPNYSEIKIVNLLNHTSGLPDYLYEPEFLEAFIKNPKQKRSPEDNIQSVSNKSAIHPVGKGWSYSDTNYIILGLIIEKVTATDLYDLINKEFLKPLQLTLTSPSNKLKLNNLVQGYVGSRNPFQLPTKVIDKDGLLVLNPAIEWAGGGFISNPTDLVRFSKFIHESDYLNKELKKLLHTPVNLKSGLANHEGYGLGTFVFNKKEDIWFGHSGFFPGYLSHVEYSLKRKYAISIQINTDDIEFKNLQQYILQLEEIIDEQLYKNN